LILRRREDLRGQNIGLHDENFGSEGEDREQTEHRKYVCLFRTVNHKVSQIEMWRECPQNIYLRWRREARTWHALNQDFDLD
jgi:hypothetical protein